MRYREVVIDGQVFLEIVEDEPEPHPPADDAEKDDDEDPKPDNDRGRVWIGELVPFA